jgi:hypothetical protein
MAPQDIGANTFATAAQYDTLFIDVIVNSELRKNNTTTKANGYEVKFPKISTQIFKAELVEVYVPSATDTTVNIKAESNRLYFTYSYDLELISGFIVIQPGTYLNPQSIAKELQRQFNIFFQNTIGDSSYGINIGYNINLNRYIFTDKNTNNPPTHSIQLFKIGDPDPTIPAGIIINSIEKVLKLYTSSSDSDLMQSNPIIIKGNTATSGQIKPQVGTTGDYGVYKLTDGSTGSIPLSDDTLFGNSIVSDVVLTNCKIFLSLGSEYTSANVPLQFADGGENSTSPQGQYIFSQIPTNCPVSSSTVRTLLNQPSFFSCTQYYNPTITGKNKFTVNWFNEYGDPLDNILEHCFTIRFYYFQKSNQITQISTANTSNYGSAAFKWGDALY